MRSVVIATYNGEKYIKDQLKSILDQLNIDDEVIISDSNSADSTLSIIRDFDDKRIKIYSFNPPDNKFSEFNIINKIRLSFINGLRYAKGDIIFLADQDDIWEMNKVEECEKELNLNNLCLLVHSCSIINSDGEKLLDNSYGVFSKPKISFLQTLIRSPFQGCCMVFNRVLLNEILCNSDIVSSINLSHDHAISYFALTKFGKEKIKLLNKPLIRYRRHGSNVSASSENSSHTFKFKILYRIYECIMYFKLKTKYI